MGTERGKKYRVWRSRIQKKCRKISRTATGVRKLNSHRVTVTPGTTVTDKRTDQALAIIHGSAAGAASTAWDPVADVHGGGQITTCSEQSPYCPSWGTSWAAQLDGDPGGCEGCARPRLHAPPRGGRASRGGAELSRSPSRQCPRAPRLLGESTSPLDAAPRSLSLPPWLLSMALTLRPEPNH